MVEWQIISFDFWVWHVVIFILIFFFPFYFFNFNLFSFYSLRLISYTLCALDAQKMENGLGIFFFFFRFQKKKKPRKFFFLISNFFFSSTKTWDLFLENSQIPIFTDLVLSNNSHKNGRSKLKSKKKKKKSLRKNQKKFSIWVFLITQKIMTKSIKLICKLKPIIQMQIKNPQPRRTKIKIKTHNSK